MIGDKNGIARAFDNRAFYLHFVEIVIQQRAVQINAADTQNAVVQTKLGNKRNGDEAQWQLGRLKQTVQTAFATPANKLHTSVFSTKPLATLPGVKRSDCG